MSGTSDRRPPKRDLKSAILWCARWLVEEDGKPYSGRHLSVKILAAGQGEVIEVKPIRGSDGIEQPQLVRLAEPTGPGVAAGRDELLQLMFSADETNILRALAVKEPSKASDVMDRARMEKSKFWVLWSNLQHRGFIGDADEGEGFVILPAWVRELVADGAKGRPAA
jgi:hypothetical protein